MTELQHNLHEMGLGGHCICPKCGKRMPHNRGMPCQLEKCPDCGAKLLREGPVHHRQWLAKHPRAEA